jgi:Phosphate-induced protein 1 conserved region
MRAPTLIVFLLVAAFTPPTTACRPRAAAAATHGGRSLGEIDVPHGPVLQGARYDGPDDGDRVSLRPSNAATLRDTIAHGARWPIVYHGGQVVDHPITVYYLWYGNWSTASAAPAIVEEFTRYLGASDWWGTNAGYVDARGKAPSTSVTFGASAYDAYSQGATVADDAIAAAVVKAIAKGALPDDPRGVYMVLGSADVDATSGFCTAYCGFHKVVTLPNGAHRYYGYVGDTRRCGLGCAMQHVGPNGDSPADGMISIIAHELAEVVTDPYADAWYDAAGLENTDKCIWVFGNTYIAPNGAKANMKLGERDYLVQANWKLDAYGNGKCEIR